jgi:hypothetical protein
MKFKYYVFGLLIISFISGWFTRATISNQISKVKYNWRLREVERLSIKMDIDELNKLNFEKDSVLRLISLNNDFWPIGGKKKKHSAVVEFNDVEYKAKLKLGGHYQDHLKHPFSLKMSMNSVDVKKKKINVINPLSRFLIVDKICNIFLDSLGLITLNSDPILVDLNGVKNVYLNEESFSSHRLNDSDLFVFTSVFFEDSIYFKTRIKNNQNQFILNSITEENLLEYVDLDNFANYLAVSHLFQSVHQLFSRNQRYVFDKERQNISPINREMWFVKASKKGTLMDGDSIFKDHRLDVVIKLLMKNDVFCDLLDEKRRFLIKSDFINSVLKDNRSQILKLKELYWTNFAWYKAITEDDILENKEHILNYLLALDQNK